MCFSFFFEQGFEFGDDYPVPDVPNNPEQHKPERLFLSSYASKRKKKPFAIHDYTAEHDYNADKVAMMGSSSSGTAG